MYLLDELGHPLLQFFYAFFINRDCWIGKTGTNGLEALVLLLFDCIINCFSGIWLMKMGQYVVDVLIFETAIPFDLQMKLKLPFPTVGVTGHMGLLPLLHKNTFPIIEILQVKNKSKLY